MRRSKKPAPRFTRRALEDAWNAGYELASLLVTSSRGICSEDCSEMDYTFAECKDPRVHDWVEDHSGFWRIFREFRLGFQAYLVNQGAPFDQMATLIKTDDPDWLLGPDAAE